MVPDPDSVRPSDWDDDEDGPWAPEMIKNPVCESQAKTVRASDGRTLVTRVTSAALDHACAPAALRWCYSQADLYAAAYAGRQ